MARVEPKLVVAMYRSGKTIQEIANALAVSVGGVHYALVKQGEPRRSRGSSGYRDISTRLASVCLGHCEDTGLCPDLWKCRNRILRNGANGVVAMPGAAE